MKFTRRDLLVWGAGAAAGLVVSPVPWKVLDDVSIWSQNWPWIPQPARGPVEVKQSFCTLCPNGCGLRVRMAGGWPVGVAGVSTHPISRGALCPLGFAAHQLNWHPRRLRAVQHHGQPSSWSEAQAAFAKARGEGPIVFIDGYPGRAASSVLKTFAEKQGGTYRVVTSSESRALAPYEAWTGVPNSSLGYDLENAQTVVSFGAPLLDGWGTPGRFTRLWAERAGGMTDPQLRLIQIDSSFSRTAARAWQWVPIRDGSESALASGLARVLLEQKLVPAHGPIPPIALSEVAAQTGLSADAIQDLARTFVSHLPVLAIAGDNDPAIAALNIVLGSVGARGGIVRRSKNAESYVAADADIPNARAVLIDGSVPWDFAPQTEAEVFRFAAWDGGRDQSRLVAACSGLPGRIDRCSDCSYVISRNLRGGYQSGEGAHRVHECGAVLECRGFHFDASRQNYSLALRRSVPQTFRNVVRARRDTCRTNCIGTKTGRAILEGGGLGRGGITSRQFALRVERMAGCAARVARRKLGD